MLFAAAAEAASNGEEQTQTSPENGPQITRSRTIEICGLEQYQSGQLPRNPFLTSNVDHRQRTCRLRVLRIEIPPLRVRGFSPRAVVRPANRWPRASPTGSRWRH